jgi:hypothetical protein
VKIALLPLDERPVNTRLVRDIAAIGGHHVLLPPASLLPRMRRPGSPDELAAWLTAISDGVDAAVLCVDLLCFGGLIASRTSSDSVLDAFGRLAVLSALRAAHPRVDLSAVSLVMRASDSYDNTEEPQYWSDYGRDLHRLGGRLHAAVVSDAVGEPVEPAAASVPREVVADFEQRRLRNHLVNLECLRLHSSGLLDALVITADDTAVRSAGSAEQLWLRHWRRALGLEGVTAMYPGADEVGAVLIARAVGRGRPAIRVRVVTPDPAALAIVPPYENGPLDDALTLQITAAGGVRVGVGEAAEIVMVVHPPNGRGDDWYQEVPPEIEPDEAAATAELVASQLATGTPVAVADVRHTNGGDPALVAALAARGAIEPLIGYGGWNTASNAIGSAVAAAMVTAHARAAGTVDEAARRRLVLHRVLEDVGYQSVIRAGLLARARRSGEAFDPVRLLPFVAAELADYLRRIAPREEWRVERVRLPWERLFEVDFELAPANR